MLRRNQDQAGDEQNNVRPALPAVVATIGSGLDAELLQIARDRKEADDIQKAMALSLTPAPSAPQVVRQAPRPDSKAIEEEIAFQVAMQADVDDADLAAALSASLGIADDAADLKIAMELSMQGQQQSQAAPQVPQAAPQVPQAAPQVPQPAPQAALQVPQGVPQAAQAPASQAALTDRDKRALHFSAQRLGAAGRGQSDVQPAAQPAQPAPRAPTNPPSVGRGQPSNNRTPFAQAVARRAARK